MGGRYSLPTSIFVRTLPLDCYSLNLSDFVPKIHSACYYSHFHSFFNICCYKSLSSVILSFCWLSSDTQFICYSYKECMQCLALAS
ncbi:hypothetical protein EB796_022591 [Bugula neritina]|uniref:Uncharacterized protein n=1 Tax=Bugula neritina TaxID=10212 RepID=A0A7J7J0C8_BUGNE|nr:hypothetical protein EB796_022591 [Bugula neritina]